jgi:hypothetical protein
VCQDVWPATCARNGNPGGGKPSNLPDHCTHDPKELLPWQCARSQAEAYATDGIGFSLSPMTG